MATFSKPQIPYSCYEVGHTWTPHCSDAAGGIGVHCFLESLKIYTSVYLLSVLVSGKIPDSNGWKRIIQGILQSSAFLACNGFGFISWFCICRKIFGTFTPFTIGFLPSFIANWLAILVERPSRRSALTIYVTNVASETLFNMLVARGIVKPIPNGQVLIFSLTLAALFRWYRTTRDTGNFQFKMLRSLLGNEELQPSSNPTSGNFGILGIKHPLCPHKQGCLKYFVKVFVQRFMLGWSFHAAVSGLFALPTLVRKPSRLLTLVTQSKHLRFGAFLALLTSVYRIVHCILRWSRNSNSINHSIIAGLFAGASAKFYSNSTVILYLMWKTIQTLYYEGRGAGIFPHIPCFDILLYSLSTSILFHAGVLEPHNLKPAYWKYLKRVTNNKIAEMNRHLMTEMGTDSTKLLPDFQPSYIPKFLSHEFRSAMGINIES